VFPPRYSFIYRFGAVYKFQICTSSLSVPALDFESCSPSLHCLVSVSQISLTFCLPWFLSSFIRCSTPELRTASSRVPVQQLCMFSLTSAMPIHLRFCSLKAMWCGTILNSLATTTQIFTVSLRAGRLLRIRVIRYAMSDRLQLPHFFSVKREAAVAGPHRAGSQPAHAT
jgi:hypothetical protein